MKITEQVYLAGSGKHGFEMSHTLDCNVYVLDGGDEFALIDAGGGVEPERIERQLELDGIPKERITKLLLTHAHGDHAAGAAYFRSAYGLEVIALEEAAPWVEAADMEKTSLKAAMQSGAYPPDFRYPACKVDRRVKDNDRIAVGRAMLTVIETPGHSRGHACYRWMEDGVQALFSGDVIFAGGKIVLQSTWDCVIAEYAASMARLDRLQVERLYPGHGAFLFNEAWKHIHRAQLSFESLELPPGL